MNWSQIPSLAALRAFEAAARHGSLSAAARELNVTHAAIAQHLRTLEGHYGGAMMVRDGAGMRLTEIGRALADPLSDAFGIIASASHDVMRRDAERPLRVALTPSFASAWLMPRIGGFWARHPDIQIELVPAPQLVDLRADGFDLAIRFGKRNWSGLDVRRLVNAGHVVVAAPGLVAASDVNSMSDLQDQHWLLEHGRAEETFWAAQQGLDLDRARITRFDTNLLVIEAVRAGHGVGILPAPIVAAEVARGGLGVLFEETDSDLAYHLLTRPAHVSKPLKAFTNWLLEQI